LPSTTDWELNLMPRDRTTARADASIRPGRLNRSNVWQYIMGELPRVRPKSRKAWRNWLEKNHASSKGVRLVYAKKRSELLSLTYNDAVEEALCFGWIDSKVTRIDDSFYMQVFTPRKRASVWSALNRVRAERLLAAGLMTPAGLSVVNTAKELGTWNAWKDVDELEVPLDLEKAIKANPEAAHNWVSYAPSRRKGVLYRLARAKRPETRARHLRDIIENMARNLSQAERMRMARFRPKPKSSRRAKR
jgi:uncharacterized protein YdeI (YjbR/CyaY-like superfamily)